MGASSSVSSLASTSTSADDILSPVDENKLFVPFHKAPPTTTSSKTCGYEFASKIGEGAFSDVRTAYRKDNREKICIKEINMAYYIKEYINECVFEFNILSQLNHPNIVKIYEVFYSKKMYFMVSELLVGGELFDSICERQYYTEGDARSVMKTTAEALTYCHSRNVIHRDIKPENLILQDKSPDSKIKLIDFGFARVLTDTMKTCSDIRGSSMYLSPEMINGSYGTSTDVWSLGVVFYIMLSGVYPFESPTGDVEETKQIISLGKFTFPAQMWTGVSLQAKDLISSMLTLAPEERITMADVLEHPWMINQKQKEVDISKNIVTIKKFQHTKRMKAAALAVKATMVFKTWGKNNNLKQKILDAAKVRAFSRSDSLSTTKKSTTKKSGSQSNHDLNELGVGKESKQCNDQEEEGGGEAVLWYEEEFENDTRPQ